MNSITIYIFNKDKNVFKLKQPSSYRLANNYIYGNSAPLNKFTDGTLNCTTDNDGKLIECEIDPNSELGFNSKCLQCKQISARCINIKEPIYSSVDSNEIVIQPNSSPSMGYCLPSDIISSSCTRKNGGKWILTSQNDDVNDEYIVYRFECFCSTPQFFQNNIFDGNNCTTYVGCRNGYLANKDTWRSYEDMRCTCPSLVYEERRGDINEPPTCIPLNIYRRKYLDNDTPFEILEQQYINPNYLKLFTSNVLNIPNPCTFDITTKTFIKNIGRVTFDKSRKIAYCESINSNYKTVVINDDYLIGNSGKYANALFRIRINDVTKLDSNKKVIKTETNDDSDDNYNDYDVGIMYEVYRKGTSRENIAGIRIPYSNFPLRLPYLENESYNMGNAYGRKYNLYPIIPKERQKYAMIYIFDANIPQYKIDVILGNGIQYIPSFMSTSFDSYKRVYNGAIPCVNVTEIPKYYNRRAFRIMYPIPPAIQYKEKLGTTGIMGSLYNVDTTSDNLTSGYGFHFAYKGRVEPYTSLFTGTLFTFSMKNNIYTRPVSCGDLVLTTKYRRNYDKNWRNQPKEPIIGISNETPFQFAITGRDGPMFTRNSYDIERNEIGVTSKKISRYDVSESKIKFNSFYS